MLAFKTQRGFSLLEILIAITLLAFITLAVVNVTDSAFQTQERTTEYNKNSLQIESALARFEWDFSQIYSPLYFSVQQNVQFGVAPGGVPQPGGDDDNIQDPDGSVTPRTAPNANTTMLNPALQMFYSQMMSRFERNERFVGLSREGEPIPRMYAPEKSVFEFFTSSNRRKMENTPQSHFAWVRYALSEQTREADEEKVHPDMPSTVKAFIRYFSADNPFDDTRFVLDGLNSIKGAVLLKNVEALEFQFWDLQKRKWETNLRTIQNGDTVIRGVKVIITWWDSGGKRTLQRVFRPHWPLVAPNDVAATVSPNKPDRDGDGKPDEDDQDNTP